MRAANDSGEVYYSHDSVSDMEMDNVIEAFWYDAHDERRILATRAYRRSVVVKHSA